MRLLLLLLLLFFFIPLVVLLLLLLSHDFRLDGGSEIKFVAPKFVTKYLMQSKHRVNFLSQRD